MQQLLVLFCLFLPLISHGQDERFYRQMLKGELPKLTEEVRESPVSVISVDGPLYNLDLNDDGKLESIRPAKREGIDWIQVLNDNKTSIFEGKMLAIGGESSLYKMRLVHLSKKSKALILFLDEGSTSGLMFESTARIFVLSWDDNDLTTMKLTQGPHHYHEKEKQRDQYWTRDFQVDVSDLNNDGVREIIVHYNHIQRVMQYEGKGVWKRL